MANLQFIPGTADMRRISIAVTTLALLSSSAPSQEILLRATPHTTIGSGVGTANPGDGENPGPTTPLAVSSPGDVTLDVAEEWSLRFAASGGNPAYGYVAVGAPSGISASADGVLTGLAEPDVYAGIRMRVTDAAGGSVLSQSITVTVGGPGVLAATPASITGLDVIAPRRHGTPQTVTFRNSGDRPVALPAMSVAGSFEIVANESASRDCGATLRRVETCDVRVRATSAANGQAGPITGSVGGVQLAGRVIVPTLAVDAATLADASVGAPYSHTFAATRSEIPASDPLTWSSPSTLPAGLTLAPTTGVLSGTPAAATTDAAGASFEIVATHMDASGRETFTLKVGPEILTGVTQIASGQFHSCAVVSGSARCWGRNTEGQLGTGNYSSSQKPVQVAGLTSDVTQITSGRYHTCAIVSGAAKCWGEGSDGQLGDGTWKKIAAPVQVSGLAAEVTQIVAGALHTCAIVSGAAKCWGDNGGSSGTLGDGTTEKRARPVQVTGLASGATQISAGTHHTCAVISGSAKCWGFNGDGQLGDGTTTTSRKPVQVFALDSEVTQISAGNYHTCAVVSGSARCWGSNTYGRIGDGTTVDRRTPVHVSSLAANVTQIDAGWNHTCAVVSGSAYCWGSNETGRIGDGTGTHRPEPVKVSGLTTGVTQISADIYHTCAVISGSARCWGRNAEGQLGDGTYTARSIPTAVLPR